MPMLAFLPWCIIEEDIDLAEIKLLRYQQKQLPFKTDQTKQAICDKVLSTYRIDEESPIISSTILQLYGKDVLEDLTEDDRADVFSLNKIITFSALSVREYFRYSNSYWNSSNLSLFIQRFQELPEPYIAVTTRRRDGSTTNVVDVLKCKTYRPHHVHNVAVSIDIPS